MAASARTCITGSACCAVAAAARAPRGYAALAEWHLKHALAALDARPHANLAEIPLRPAAGRL
jgi:hypothetical protein